MTALSTATYKASSLTTALPYRFKIAVITEIGEGAISGITTLYAGDLASAPGAPAYVNSSAEVISVEWTPPTDTGGNEISGYRLEVSYYNETAVPL